MCGRDIMSREWKGEKSPPEEASWYETLVHRIAHEAVEVGPVSQDAERPEIIRPKLFFLLRRDGVPTRAKTSSDLRSND